MTPELLATPVAELVRRQFVSVRPQLTLAAAIEEVRQAAPKHRIVYFYAVDDGGTLVGVLPTRAMLLGDPAATVAELMLDRFVAVPGTLPLLEACEFFILHRLLALPVVDEDGRLVGVIDVDQFAEGLTELEAATEGEEPAVSSDAIFQLIGLRLASHRGSQASLIGEARERFLWLLCNVAGGLLAAGVMALFRTTLDRLLAVAMFVPVVLALAESVSIQSLTLALRDHVPGSLRAALRTASRTELPVGLLLGLACGTLLALVAGVLVGSGRFAVVLLVGLLVALSWAALLGRVVPTLLGAGGRDPKVASGPLVLTLTDLGTLLAYLTLAALLV